jgi:hypothetical protein
MKKYVTGVLGRCAAGTVAGFLALGVPLVSGAEPGAGSGVRITETGDKVRVEINGKLFTEYNFKDVPRPFFYPLIGPTGVGVTRNWPMKDVEKEDKDHPHHCGLWFTHGSVNGLNFWANGKETKIANDKFLEIKSGPEEGVLKTSDKWLAPDGKIVCTDTRMYKFYNKADCRLMDFEITIHASNGDVVFEDTKEGSMSIRVLPVISVKGKGGQGHLVNSRGDRDLAAWGKQAEWCDYSGPVDGKVVGVSIFDHPSNPRHPTHWHAREYGLMTANPFGLSDFEKKPKGTGDMKIPAGGNVTFRYRIYVHEGDDKVGKVAERYKEYTSN